MAAPTVAHVEKMLKKAEQCARYYQDQQLNILGSMMAKLQLFTDTSAKRCKDKHLDEAAQLLGSPEHVLGQLSDGDILPLLCYIFKCQLDSCNSTCSFQKLEKLLLKFSQVRPHLVSQERESLLTSLLQGVEVLQLRDLQTVCMYLEGSPASQNYFKEHIHSVLSVVQSTFSVVLQDKTTKGSEQCYLTVKICLQIFRELAEEIIPQIWTPASSPNSIQTILEFLVQVMIAQDASRDTRLLAGTAMASLVNTSPSTELGAQAGLNLVLWLRDCTGKVRFGGLSVSMPCSPTDEVGLLALIRGLLTCSRADLLSYVLLAFSQEKTMLEHLFPAISSICRGQTEEYYSFQVLCLWLQRVRDHIAEILLVRNGLLVANNGEILSEVTLLLWAGAEMPIDGMSGLILSCFQHCLHIYHTECQLMELSEDVFLQDMLQKIMKTSWQSRSRYTPLCALIPFLGPNLTLTMYPNLPAHLFNCLSTNYLCPPASETYRILITLQRKEWSLEVQQDEKELGRCWAMTWLIHLCDALRSTESSLQSNAATHLLPCTLSCFSESFTLLSEQLSGPSPSDLCGWICLLRAQKVVLGGVTEDVEKRLQACLESADDGVRLNALSFLCCGTRTSQPLSPQELRLLRTFLPYNLGCDNSGFRQQLQAALRRAIERLRDGALTALRKGQSQEISLCQAIDFLEWLLQLSVSTISTAGNYQRRCSGLLTFSALLESCSDCWTPQKKKGQPPRDMSVLLTYARQRGCWDFFSVSNMKALLGCIQDSTNEIREMASDLLVRFFLPAPEPVFLPLYELGKAILCSPRVPLAEVGALIMKTLMQSPQGVVVSPGNEPVTMLRLVTFLTEMLQEHYNCARDNLLLAATSKPLHGVLSALRLCLLEVPAVSQSFSQSNLTPSWRPLLSCLVSTLQEIASFILSALQKAWDEDIPDAVAPSFEDMGKAVNALIAQGCGLDEVHGSVLISEEHSLIMTCCWVSLKEIGVLLGPLVERLISSPVPLLSVSAVQESVATYQDIFMRCRHWGAVEGCIAGFTKLCCALLCNEDQKLSTIPGNIMEQGLAECRSQHSVSVTRRGAGFPVLLQSILCAEGSPHTLLVSCVSSLLELAKEPLPSDWDLTRDLPQVSAVHALQTMLRSSVLRSNLLTHAVKLMSLALHNLRSPCWSMRNAALQLFSALTGGMLGLSRSHGDSSVKSTVSVGALLRRFPGLKNVLRQELQDSQQSGKVLHPSLHPVLTLLARLQPGGDNEADCFLDPLLCLAGNPIYAVRVIAARAIVPIVQEDNYHHLLLQLAQSIPKSSGVVSHNALHGCLLQIHALLAETLKENRLPESFGCDFAQRLLPALWLLSPSQKCPLIRASFLDVLSLLVPMNGAEYARLVDEAVCTALKAQDFDKQVGSDVFHEACVLYMCKESDRLSDHVNQVVLQLLQDGDPALYKWLKGKINCDMSSAMGKAVRDALQDKFCSVLLSGSAPEDLTPCLEAFVHVHSVCFPSYVLNLPEKQEIRCAHILLGLLESGREGPQLQGQALRAVGLLLKHGTMLQDISVCSRWLDVLSSCADPVSSCEELRLAAAHALHVGGADLVRQALGDSTYGLTQLAVRQEGSILWMSIFQSFSLGMLTYSILHLFFLFQFVCAWIFLVLSPLKT
ncbi:tRNA (32-2'-O)-methyltransferase regulator THADA-like [Pelobates fuscus]|uniref:tRNA (32-2'-O)-methyltransferase regulator THADA-like n=1 Tax=Pelobates fuscus TaxID=191477 RepID=UPI002FE438A9